MPGRVLREHGIVTSDGSGHYILNVKDNLTREQVSELVQLCNVKINEYEQKYGLKSIWHSRFATARNISGPLQYEVLKRARGRCELCGVSRKVKALQVDHIRPYSKGGPTAPENLQALLLSP